MEGKVREGRGGERREKETDRRENKMDISKQQLRNC